MILAHGQQKNKRRVNCVAAGRTRFVSRGNSLPGRAQAETREHWSFSGFSQSGGEAAEVRGFTIHRMVIDDRDSASRMAPLVPDPSNRSEPHEKSETALFEGVPARGSIEVAYKPTDEERIPDVSTEGIALLMDLRSRGRLDEAGQRMRIRRQGGYSGLDVWTLLLVFFTTGTRCGVRKFWDKLRSRVLQLGALAGRRSLPAPASLSRALDAVKLELLRGEPARWLLTGVSDIDVVLRHPTVQTYDACGHGWHVFDLDPTVTTLRHRALPLARKR